MAQKKKKNKSVSSNRRGNLLANTKAKKSSKKANLSSQIIIINTENVSQISDGGKEGTQKFNLSRCQHKKKKKSVVNTKKASLSNQIIISNTENVSQISDGGKEGTQKFNLSRCQHKKKKKSFVNTKKANLSNQIIIGNTENVTNNGEEEATQNFNLSGCQHKKKKQICKGKSPSNGNTDQMEIDQVMRIHISEEIMTDILSRLPVRSLLRFKCVSKFWKSLIVDPYFRRTHYIQSQNSQKLLITKRCLGKDDVYSFYSSSLSSVQVVEDEQKLDWPMSCKPVNVKMYCSFHGLVLIGVCPRRNHAELWLWNPATRESILLPPPEFGLLYCVNGLAYDATCEDYKILAVHLNGDDSLKRPIELLSLKSGSWRRIGYPTCIKHVRGFRDCGMNFLPFLHGAFHWLGRYDSGYYTTISFNISNEVYGEVPLLEQMYDIWRRNFFVDTGVSVLRGMLCFYSTGNYGENRTAGTFKLWVMKDYGVRESWIKLIEIGDTDLFCSARPKYMFADCEVLLHCKRIGCVSSKFTTSRGPFGLCPQCNITKQGIVYAESFVSPKLLT